MPRTRIIAIGFLSYDDFLSELAAADGKCVVRVQGYYRTVPLRNINAYQVNHFVEVASLVDGHVFVCRFRVGSALELDKERVRWNDENAARIATMLKEDLERRGYTVRPGVYADAKGLEVLSAGPWRWEKDENGLPVPVWIQDEE